MKKSPEELARFRMEYHQLQTISKETEKSIGVPVTWHFEGEEIKGEEIGWIPRSTMRGSLAPGWMIVKKSLEGYDKAVAAYRDKFGKAPGKSKLIVVVAGIEFDFR